MKDLQLNQCHCLLFVEKSIFPTSLCIESQETPKGILMKQLQEFLASPYSLMLRFSPSFQLAKSTVAEWSNEMTILLNGLEKNVVRKYKLCVKKRHSLFPP